MESISSNLSLPVHMNQNAPSISFNPGFGGVSGNKNSLNDTAFAFLPNINDIMPKFDFTMNNLANFKDLISTAQYGVDAMKEQGESIRDLIAQAKEEGVTPELLDKIQAEVDSRVAEINRIREGAVYNGINPFERSFSLDVPDILELMGKNDKEEVNNEITNMLASFDIDINIEGDGFSMGGAAKIEIGYTAEGALQINVDASMDYDLSGLVNNGVTSDEAFDLINNFIDMLGVQQGDLANAQNFLDAIFEQMFNTMNGNMEALPDGIEITPDSSNSLKGQMVQQASITLDGMANLAPSISINIL